MSTMSKIPWDIILEILSRLPAKTLLRLRTVSKTWCTLIDSNEFKNKHLIHATKTYSLSLILRGRSLYSIDLNSVEDQIISDFLYELKHPFKCDFFYYQVISHCNGLLFFSNSSKELVLWNPTTQKHQNVRCPEIGYSFDRKMSSFEEIVYGFGYDSVADDYKVVRVVQFCDREDEDSIDSQVEVYSLKSNSWRLVKDFPYYIVYSRVYGVFVGGGLHWIVCRKLERDSTRLIAAFDLETEEYYIVPQPKYENEVFHYNIDVLGGCLCIVGYDYSHHHVSIWVMKEYGVESSWTKLLSFSDSVITTFWVLEYVKPIAYSKCGKKVLLKQNEEALFWYDIESESLAYVDIRWSEMSVFFGTFVCVDSLVHSLVHLNEEPV